jgi:hypothetical protein
VGDLNISLKKRTISSLSARLLIGGALVLGVLGCAGPVKGPEDLRARTTVETGSPECQGCYLLKSLLTPTIDSDLHAVKDSQNIRTGQRISASIKLGASNRTGGFREGISLGRYGYDYGMTLTGEGHLFEEKVKSDVNHPFRFFFQIHHNSSFGTQDVYLVTSKGEYILIPPFSFRGMKHSQSCFASGCVWDDDYVVSAKYVNRLIEQNEPLKVFVGIRQSRDVASKDGLNPAQETFNSGVNLRVDAAYLKSFIETVKANVDLN